MKRSMKVTVGVLVLLVALVPIAVPSAAAADPAGVISNGTIDLGINPEGDLNGAGVGIRYIPTGNDGIIPGCPCEGWGAGDQTSMVSGYAGRSSGIMDVAVEDFVRGADSAVSTTLIPDAVTPIMRVTHDFHVSPASPNVFEVTVTIENTSAAEQVPRYRRAMDWDIPPTTFDEAVTIQGTAGSANVIFASDDGFAVPDPFEGDSWINFTGDAVQNVDQVLTPGGQGPSSDHGALFDFRFDPLPPGDSHSFNIYYGAAGSQTAADLTLAAIDAEVFSYGQPSDATGLATGEPNTFIFAFQGVGGAPQVADPLTLSPETATNPIGTSHTVTANLTLSDQPIADQEILFEVLTGPNAGAMGTATSDAEGNASFSYEGNSVGTDQIQAYTTLLDQELESNIAEKAWVDATTATTSAPTTTAVAPVPVALTPTFTG